MFVWATVVKDSTYGSFKMAMYGYESYDYDSNGNLIMIHDEHHWFTDHKKGADIYTELTQEAYHQAMECQWSMYLTMSQWRE